MEYSCSNCKDKKKILVYNAYELDEKGLPKGKWEPCDVCSNPSNRKV